MNTLLIFFAFPVAVIILAAVLQTVLNNPISVAAVFFAIFLVITFAFFDSSFLIATIAYTILAYISAALTRVIENVLNQLNSDSDSNSSCGCNMNNDDDNTSCGCNRACPDVLNNKDDGISFIRRNPYRCG